MTTAAYDIGDQRRLQGDFVDVDGNPVDPTVVVLTIREPDGGLVSKTGVELGNPDIGSFTYDYTLTKPGRHVVNWAGTAGTVAAGEHELWARRKQAAV